VTLSKKRRNSAVTDFQMRAIFELIINLLKGNKNDEVIKMLTDILRNKQSKEEKEEE
jgi:diphthamide synthase subunit DPH2